jgi:hypothetical protein
MNVRVGQSITVEQNGRWKTATVVLIDCNIVKLHFTEDDVMEWLYRGSKRLGVITKLMEAPERKMIPGIHKKNDPFIEYIVIDDEEETAQKNPVRAVAKKSTSQRPLKDLNGTESKEETISKLPESSVKSLNDNQIYIDCDDTEIGQIRYLKPRKNIEAKKFESHQCGPKCIIKVNYKVDSYGPLAKPLLQHFERLIFRHHKFFKQIVYRAPCGRMLRNMDDVYRFLEVSKCSLNVESFDFDPAIQALAAYNVDKERCGLYIDDISNGLEKMKIPIVNVYDNTHPPSLIYSNVR